jgi:hypothetical protein
MQSAETNLPSLTANFDFASWSLASKCLFIYGGLMLLGLVLTYLVSLSDVRTFREVGVWVKPMKFMAATALFAWTTVWLAVLANTNVTHTESYKWICVLIVLTSLFEVVYITYQAFQGEASHYNNTDPFHAMMFGVMALAAVGLTASQAWLAWEIWAARESDSLSVSDLGVIIGLTLTFVLSTISGFMLGGNQPPAGHGLPFVGWHLYKDIRPAHFLGVHAQQLIPLLGLLVERFSGAYALKVFSIGSAGYISLWGVLTWLSLSN